MALTNAGTQVLVNDNKLPTGYTKPTVTTFEDIESKYKDRAFVVVKSVVENADPLVTFAAIVDAITTAVSALITADYDVTNTVTAFANLKDVATNLKNGDALYNADVVDYDCIVDIFIKTA